MRTLLSISIYLGGVQMETERWRLVEWLKAHKDELLLIGVSAAAIIGAILCYRNNKEEILSLWKTLKNEIKKVPQHNVSTSAVNKSNIILIDKPHPISRTSHSYIGTKIPQDVSSHLRNLPKGQKASASKLATAFENGYLLQPGQTWVKDYTKNKISA